MIENEPDYDFSQSVLHTDASNMYKLSLLYAL